MKILKILFIKIKYLNLTSYNLTFDERPDKKATNNESEKYESEPKDGSSCSRNAVRRCTAVLCFGGHGSLFDNEKCSNGLTATEVFATETVVLVVVASR